MDCNLSFPWEMEETLKFLAYLLFTRKVKSSTANCQLSGVRMAHLEIGLDSPSLRPPIVELLLKGHLHWESVARTLEEKPNRTPVTIEMMTLIKRKLYEENWDLEHKLRFWSVATLLFAGSLRVSVVLAKQLNYYYY